MQITYLHLTQPINGKKRILDEESFKRIVLGGNKTTIQIAQEHGLYESILTASTTYWRHKYDSEIRNRQHSNYTKSAYARPVHVTPDGMRIEITKDVLKSMLAEEKTEFAIAKELNISPQTLRKSLRKHHLYINSRKLRNVSDEDYYNLEWLDQLEPGIINAFYSATENPKDFFELLYNGFIKILKILWTVQKFSGRYSEYLGRKKLVRSHISWRINRHEIVVSERLRELGVDHIRDYFWAKSEGRNFSADVFIPNKNLIVEIDGDVHNIGVVKIADKEKNECTKRLGYNHLRFTTKEVDKSLEEVIKKILEYGE
jgi:hypothetical protein